ncbi:sulfate ABC transporter permease [Bryobacterales bacterium F-183]|nr:sulfate ABC transporter permease [Bryobacterales bacterium F-183]
MKRVGVLPGFGLTFGFTVLWLSALVLIPLSLLFFRAASLNLREFLDVVLDPRAVASYRVTLFCSLAAAIVNAIAGPIVAWTLIRVHFPGRKLLDAVVDLPFALPTAVSGIALTAVYAKNGILGSKLAAIGIPVAFTPLGIIVALTFIGLPFVVRTMQPAIEDLDPTVEEAASILGASKWQIFRRIIVPALLPSLLTGFALAFARALGEYGSVIFISGNMPLKTEVTALLIVTKLEQFDYAGATAIGAVQLAASFVLLFAINGLQWWSARRTEGTNA